MRIFILKKTVEILFTTAIRRSFTLSCSSRQHKIDRPEILKDLDSIFKVPLISRVTSTCVRVGNTALYGRDQFSSFARRQLDVLEMKSWDHVAIQIIQTTFFFLKTQHWIVLFSGLTIFLIYICLIFDHLRNEVCKKKFTLDYLICSIFWDEIFFLNLKIKFKGARKCIIYRSTIFFLVFKKKR